jgi:hypothetical protein
MRTTTTLMTTVLAASLATASAWAGTDYREWQLNRLHAPTSQQLAQEQAGRVMIYDGLRDNDVEQVLAAEFERVGSMMFVRTVVTDDDGVPVRDDKSGKTVTEDDDC